MKDIGNTSNEVTAPLIQAGENKDNMIVEKEDGAGEEGAICVVCMDKPYNMLILECGHLCVCDECSGLIRQCPMCRGSITRFVKVFKAT